MIADGSLRFSSRAAPGKSASKKAPFTLLFPEASIPQCSVGAHTFKSFFLDSRFSGQLLFSEDGVLAAWFRKAG